MSGITERQLFRGYGVETPGRVYQCDDEHLSTVDSDREVISCPYLIGARTTCSRPARPRGAKREGGGARRP